MRTLLAAAALLFPIALTSCTSEVTTTTLLPTQTVTAGCGGCTYHIEGATGCPLAIEIDGKPMLVTGSDFDAMANGLCAEKAQVVVAGEVQGDVFAATSVTLAE